MPHDPLRRAAPVENLNPVLRTDRRPYARLSSIIRRAEAGERFADERKRRTVVTASDYQRNPGEVIAATLMAHDDPMAAEIRTIPGTSREARTAQMAGARWLRRSGHTGVRLSYERTDDGIVWTITERPA